jgi:hypothetical protein
MTNSVRKYSSLLKIAGMVPYRVTQLSDMEFAEALREGYKIVYGQEPTLEILGCGWAQAVLESGRPIKLPCNNVGNIKASKSWAESKDFFVKDAFEFNKAGEKFIEKAAKWRAYASPSEGAAGYWELIGNKRYGQALEWMAAGDPIQATKHLKAGGYFTANEAQYAKTSNALYGEFLKKIAPNMSDLRSNSVNISESEDDPSKNIDELISQLYAAAGSHQLTKIIKNSILKEKLPTNSVLICVRGSNFSDKLEYARVVSGLLRQFIEVNAIVCGENDEVEIQCKAVGSDKILVDAIKELCGLTIKGMNKTASSNISVDVFDGLISIYAAIDDEFIIKNHRRFNLNKVVSYG